MTHAPVAAEKNTSTAKEGKGEKMGLLFLLVLAADFVQSAFYFARYFESREDNFSAVLFSLLHLLPLAFLGKHSRCGLWINIVCLVI